MTTNNQDNTGSGKPLRRGRRLWQMRLDIAVGLIAVVTFLGSILGNMFYFSGLSDYVNDWRKSNVRNGLVGTWEATSDVAANKQGDTSRLRLELRVVNERLEGEVYYPVGGRTEIFEDNIQGEEVALVGYEHTQGVRSFQHSFGTTPQESMTLENRVEQTVVTIKLSGEELIVYERYEDGSESYAAVKK